MADHGIGVGAVLHVKILIRCELGVPLLLFTLSLSVATSVSHAATAHAASGTTGPGACGYRSRPAACTRGGCCNGLGADRWA